MAVELETKAGRSRCSCSHFQTIGQVACCNQCDVFSCGKDWVGSTMHSHHVTEIYG